MTRPVVTDEQVQRLVHAAAVLLPGSGDLPASADVPGYKDLLLTAVAANGDLQEDVDRAISELPPHLTLASLKDLSEADAAAFDIVAQLTSGAYYMSPVVLRCLGYETDRRQPPLADDFADEFMTGVLEPVMESEPRYRTTGTRQN